MASGSPSVPITSRNGQIAAIIGGWEHLQQLSVFIVHPDGTDLRRITGPGVCSGSPKWSSDSKRLIFYEMPVETTWDTRILFLAAHAKSQIVSFDLATGKRTERTGIRGPDSFFKKSALADALFQFADPCAQRRLCLLVCIGQLVYGQRKHARDRPVG
jgi:Tol biopolymer transport system component